MTAKEFCSQLVRHESAMLRYAYSLNLKRDDAKDLIQDTYEKALLNRDKYVDNERLKAWVLTVMRNTFVDNYRRSASMKKLSDSANDSVLVNIASDGTDSPESLLHAIEVSEIVEQLQEKMRMPFKMYLQGYKYSEISEQLNMRLGTVKSRILRSKRRLINLLNS